MLLTILDEDLNILTCILLSSEFDELGMHKGV